MMKDAMAKTNTENVKKETVEPILIPKEKELTSDALSEARIQHIEDLAQRAGAEINETFQAYKERAKAHDAEVKAN